MELGRRALGPRAVEPCRHLGVEGGRSPRGPGDPAAPPHADRGARLQQHRPALGAEDLDARRRLHGGGGRREEGGGGPAGELERRAHDVLDLDGVAARRHRRGDRAPPGRASTRAGRSCGSPGSGGPRRPSGRAARARARPRSIPASRWSRTSIVAPTSRPRPPGPDGRREGRSPRGRTGSAARCPWDPRPVAASDDRLRLAGVAPERLLDQDRDAARRGRPGERGVRVIRRDDACRLDVVAGERGLRLVAGVGAVRPASARARARSGSTTTTSRAPGSVVSASACAAARRRRPAARTRPARRGALSCRRGPRLAGPLLRIHRHPQEVSS